MSNMNDLSTADEVLLLDTKDLSIRFGGVKALRGVSLQVRRGEIACLVGENGCGKSTFTKIVSGVYTPNEGSVIIDGVPLTTHHPRAAIAAGVQVIYQDLSLFDHLSVAENIAINRFLHDGTKLIDRERMRSIAAEQLERVGIKLDLHAPISSISVASKQIVAICRALAMDAKILFMDEPTTALTTTEVHQLLRIVTQLRDNGLAIVFISHKLDEVMEVADSVTVLRDGLKVGTFPAAELTEDDLAFHMTGRRVTYERYVRTNTNDEPLLEAKNLTRDGNYRDVSLKVRSGDIVGLTGLLGSGRTELALSLYGLNRPDSGEVKIKGKVTEITSPTKAIDLGIALVPESRQEQGLFMNFSIARNVSSLQLDQITGLGKMLSRVKEGSLADDVIRRMGVNNRDAETIVANLSGGNAQKVVIGRGIESSPSVYILDSPTVGVDIGAKAEIYSQIHQMAREGMGVIIISDEPEEIVSNCNRVIVMHAGSVVAEFEADEVSHSDFKTTLAKIVANPELAGASSGSADLEATR